jgi:hypothetical protein
MEAWCGRVAPAGTVEAGRAKTTVAPQAIVETTATLAATLARARDRDRARVRGGVVRVFGGLIIAGKVTGVAEHCRTRSRSVPAGYQGRGGVIRRFGLQAPIATRPRGRYLCSQPAWAETDVQVLAGLGTVSRRPPCRRRLRRDAHPEGTCASRRNLPGEEHGVIRWRFGRAEPNGSHRRSRHSSCQEGSSCLDATRYASWPFASDSGVRRAGRAEHNFDRP